MKKIKLHLGCGQKYLEGYINCDISENVKTDKQFDLNTFPYPFPDNYADEILMDMVLEHLPDIVSVMQELYRILKNQGHVAIIVPYAKSEWAVQDPTHVHFFNERSMDYFIDDYRYNYYTNIRFKKIKAELYISEETTMSKIRKFIPFRRLLTTFIFNMYDGIHFELKAIK
jgi:predicted SAM-dependent methyltransferase